MRMPYEGLRDSPYGMLTFFSKLASEARCLMERTSAIRQ
jgi:hypothetical protein